MSEKIKIGVIGAGENTRKFHIPNFQKIEGVEVSNFSVSTLIRFS